MFFRLKRSGKRGYVQIVENTRDGAAVRQRVIANLGRADELAASGALASLIASRQAHRSGAADQCARRGCRGRAVGRRQADRRTPAVWQNWERLGVADVLIGLLKERAFEFPSSAPSSSPCCIGCSFRDRTATAPLGSRITISPAPRGSICIISIGLWPGSARNWRRAGRCAGAALPQGPGRGEAVLRRRDLFTDLSAVFMAPPASPSTARRRDARRARLLQGLSARFEADDPRPRGRRRRPADLHRDVAGNTADVTTLLPVVDRCSGVFPSAGSASSQTAA